MPNNSSNFSKKPNGTGVHRIFKAAYCSYKGFKAAYEHEAAYRQELLMCIILAPISFIIANSSTQLMVLLMTLAFVLFAEIINSAIEALADKITTEHDELIGRAKDLGSAGVFIAFGLLVFCWTYVIFERFSA
ncbi:diacylglycerol kinase [Thalassotalea sp. M1531]|uniref:Diacylglycerol kinase n=1 Tax=Thalassotalea algicola TaxID=2716224 RepID=A0A7Y0LEW8_9GAMM|nr:diacylglycerol kinase [Thalassotalea algicola]NMP33279.1 diacylglycerol kinase [Thalassotalea algicola]